MSKLIEAYTSTAGTVFKKVEASNGREMFFKDGTPIKPNAFNAGKAHFKHTGAKPKVAIPSNKGPGYERIEVSRASASALGQELSRVANGKEIEREQIILTDFTGEKIKSLDTNDLVQINDRISERWGSDIVFQY